MSENLVKSQAFKLKGRLYTFTVIQVMDIDPELFSNQLGQTVLKAPKMFDKAPVVFDLALVNHLDIDLQGLCAIAKEHGLVPVAIQGATPVQDTIAQCHGLAVLNASNAQDKEVTDSSTATQVMTSSRLITSVVRSGQQVVAKSADLIVTSSVSHGAELLADGNVHVYGTLRGRAFAGISGDTHSRIFCQSLDADLISIAGIYLSSDSFEPHHAPCQIYLVDEHIIIEPL